MIQSIYDVRDLRHDYGAKPALQVDNLSIAPAEIVGLMGPNGSGKSTLLNLLGFITRPVRGTICFKGRPAYPFADSVRFQVTLLPQEPYLMKRTVLQNIAYGLRLRGDNADRTSLIKDVLEKVGLNYRDFAHRPWHALSGGEAQRVALAARLALAPEVLLLDEPVASVDAESVQRIKEAILWARTQRGTTLVIASHDRDWLEGICDNMLFLLKGRVLGAERGNIIFGPWRRVSAFRYEKVLSDGQRFYVSAPPGASAIAAMNPGDLSFCEPDSVAGTGTAVCAIRGVVTRLDLERDNRQVRISVSAGSLSLSVARSAEILRKHPMMPGQTVVVRYRVDDIRWIGGD